MVRRSNLGHLGLVIATITEFILVGPTRTASAQSCEPAPAFAPLASVMPVPIGDCLSPDTSDGTLIRQAFSLGEFVMRTTDGAVAFASEGIAWSVTADEVRGTPLGDWLATLAAPETNQPPTGQSASLARDPVAQAGKAVHRVRVGEDWGTAVSTSIGLLTSAHLVQNVDFVELISSEGELMIAKVGRRDEIVDVALLEAATSATTLEVPEATRIMLDQQVFILGTSLSNPSSNATLRSPVSIRGKSRAPSGLQTIELDGQLSSTQSGGPVIDTDGQFLGLFAYSRRETGQAHLAISVESLNEFAVATASRTIVPGAQSVQSPSGPLPTPTAAPTPPASVPVAVQATATPIASAVVDSRIIRREFFESTATTLPLNTAEGYEYSINDREYRIFRRNSSDKYSLFLRETHLSPVNEKDIAIKLTVHLVGEVDGRYITIACRSNDLGNAYRVGFYPGARRFMIDKMINREFITAIIPWKESDSISSNPRDRNTIEFRCIGSEFSLRINNVQVAIFSDTELTSGRAWFAATPQKEAVGDTDARFSNILVTRGQ